MVDMVFEKQDRVVKHDIDRYGRIVGIVFVGDVCVNNELVRNGLAWSGCTGIIARFRFVMTG
jgi:micrococcal nuclease